MGLLDTITGGLSGSSANSGGLMDVVGSLINNPQTGGLSGLIKAFEEKGLGGLAASWVSTGQNLPISAEQIQSVLGNEQVVAFAQKLGISPQDVSAHLAQMLPQVIDKLTPNGNVPEGGGGLEQALGGLLKGFMK
jgi:uncharacterized protein YidB (DUF937 family)